MGFKSFKLVQTDMTAQRRVYEGYKTENGVHLEYYISTEMWDDKTSGNVIAVLPNGPKFLLPDIIGMREQ